MRFRFRKGSTAKWPDRDQPVGLLEPGVEVDGKMRVLGGTLRLNTHFKGEITSVGTIVVADQGEVEADISAKVVTITGKVKGAVHATERLEIREHGVILGDIYTPILVVDPGACFHGQCHMPTPEPEEQATKSLDSKERPS